MRRREEGRWTVVQRQKKNQVKTWNPNTTPFFVNGFSDSAKIGDLRRCFGGHGEVVDVYMGRHKDSAGRNYAFVKFNGVQDVRRLEEELQGIVCGGKILVVNAAKYGRDKAPTNVSSFADVIAGRQAAQLRHPTPPPPVQLIARGTAKDWVDKKVLMGEVLSLDHMASVPNQFVTGDGIIESIRYGGGLNVLITFKDQNFAEEFLEDLGRWIEWFQWVRRGDSTELCGDRIAWIKVIGLPMAYWDDENLGNILKPFGKVIVPADELPNDRDASIIKMGILTSKKNWFNTEIAVHADGKSFNIGVVEFEHKWSPFYDSMCEEEDSEDDQSVDDDDDGVSDTDIHGSASENLEDGEIPWEEDTHVKTDGANSGESPSEDGSTTVIPESVDAQNTSGNGEGCRDTDAFMPPTLNIPPRTEQARSKMKDDDDDVLGLDLQTRMRSSRLEQISMK
ncbi:hypothetical protein LXL04_015074 [Taraxacum kok-saghyz]